MSGDKEKDGTGKRKSQPPRQGSETGAAGGKTRKKRPAAPEFGNALRSVYQQTIDESIPPEMLDLLGKLG